MRIESKLHRKMQHYFNSIRSYKFNDAFQDDSTEKRKEQANFRTLEIKN